VLFLLFEHILQVYGSTLVRLHIASNSQIASTFYSDVNELFHVKRCHLV